MHFREDPQMHCNTYLDPDEQVLLPPESLSSLSFSRIPWNTDIKIDQHMCAAVEGCHAVVSIHLSLYTVVFLCGPLYSSWFFGEQV